jgi:hypothetical protein
MSGQPYVYPTDPEKFRAEYMQTLGLRANIDEMNLSANKTYKETGQLPPVSQMKDTRTTAEILADKEKLKVLLIEDLKGIGSPQFVLTLIQRIQTSPLNADGSLFTFFSQGAPEIAMTLKKRYKYGIKGDANDVEKFASFVEDLFSKTKGFSSTISHYFNRPGVDPMTGIIRLSDVNTLQSIFKELAKSLTLKFKHESRAGTIPNMIYEIGKYLLSMSIMLTEEDQTRFLENFFASRFGLPGDIINENEYNREEAGEEIDVGDNERFYNAYKRYTEILQGFPKADALYTLMDQLDKSLKNKDETLTRQILLNIKQQVTPEGVTVEEMAELVNTLRDISQRVEDIIRSPGFQHDTEAAASSHEMRTSGKYPFAESETASVSSVPPLEYTEEEEGGWTTQDYNMAITAIGQEIKKAEAEGNAAQVERLTRSREEYIRLRDEHIQAGGRGLVKRRGRPKGSGVSKPPTPYSASVVKHAVYDKGLQESPRFVKFGRYLVNLRKLNGEGIFSIKSDKGNPVVDVPSTRLSKHMSSVIKKMIGGAVLSYEDINGLSEPEKVFLHKVSKKANVMDKFTIPTPSMDKRDKDIHDFEVMKGEILSGNDSKELVRKFKTHIIRLSREGTLPKKEVSEIMEVLLELGF